ncbi:MAG TPA: universal stress protein [Bryobacteraceae bacterium]|nr:universal stress protein [Bryobacteraceae bacterium]
MSFPYRKILCPIDFDDNSLTALDEALEIARHFQAAMLVVHVVAMVVELPAVPHAFDRYEEQEKAAKAKLSEIATKKANGFAYESAVYIGDVVDSVMQAVDKFEPDLLVMATHGRSGLAHFFLGSVSEAVVRKASCPVLTIRSGTPDRPDHRK